MAEEAGVFTARFTRTAGRSLEYKALGTMDAKRKFKLEWQNTQCQRQVKQKTTSESLEEKAQLNAKW
eukprot:6479182-Amphidinium_carterae.1